MKTNCVQLKIIELLAKHEMKQYDITQAIMMAFWSVHHEMVGSALLYLYENGIVEFNDAAGTYRLTALHRLAAL